MADAKNECTEGGPSTPTSTSTAPAAPKARCQECKKLARMRCYFCGTGDFCSDFCVEGAMEEDKHVCAPIEDTTAKDLLNRVATDLFPSQPQTFIDYFFTKCKSQNDQAALLGVYRALFIDLQISCVELHSWKQGGTVHKNLLSIYIRKHRVAPVQRTTWLFTHPEVFAEEHLDLSEEGKDLLAKVAGLLPSLQKDLDRIEAAYRR
ncbi:hypothetical protein S7711_01835 [Stachybotrys chartarum IBT 7711]|uniref:Uncharacterized protein n=1 Tax=Stachybotrys chartarum (strain CBS 109288 / IBT 7711) TaxID=1280523 RepID=A0A084AJ42_STACB|nr:hypothetical protein S7711_01835 [Stachybotrys chartarum IBT 7711]